jgi:hypothetical protein
VLSLPSGVGTLLTAEGGKVLQVVRATNATTQTTTSTSFVDVTGMSVTITPQRDTSAILLVSSFRAQNPNNSNFQAQISDASNNSVSGAEQTTYGLPSGIGNTSLTIIAYATPETTAATTYKLRFKSFSGGSATILNSNQTGQIFAIEVSA